MKGCAHAPAYTIYEHLQTVHMFHTCNINVVRCILITDIQTYIKWRVKEHLYTTVTKRESGISEEHLTFKSATRMSLQGKASVF